MQYPSEGFPGQESGSQDFQETPSVPQSSTQEGSSGRSATSAESSPTKPPVSVRKIIANRSNALCSTGPTSRAGKDRVRWNSYRHGLQVKALFRLAIDGEERAAFFRFLKAFRRDLQPVGMLEEVHIEGAVVAYWLIQRSLRCEGGEIKRSQLKRTGPGGEDFLGTLVSVEATAIYDHLSVPAAGALDRILRYRTSANRDLSCHLAELERLQRARRGDHVLSPIHVQVR